MVVFNFPFIPFLYWFRDFFVCFVLFLWFFFFLYLGSSKSIKESSCYSTKCCQSCKGKFVWLNAAGGEKLLLVSSCKLLHLDEIIL